MGCSELQEPKKALKTSHPLEYVKVTYLGSRKTSTDHYKFLHVGCGSWHNHTCQLFWRSVQGVWRGEGSNFALFHWLASSPLQHARIIYRASVWLNDRGFCSIETLFSMDWFWPSEWKLMAIFLFFNFNTVRVHFSTHILISFTSSKYYIFYQNDCLSSSFVTLYYKYQK